MSVVSVRRCLASSREWATAPPRPPRRAPRAPAGDARGCPDARSRRDRGLSNGSKDLLPDLLLRGRSTRAIVASPPGIPGPARKSRLRSSLEPVESPHARPSVGDVCRPNSGRSRESAQRLSGQLQGPSPLPSLSPWPRKSGRGPRSRACRPSDRSRHGGMPCFRRRGDHEAGAGRRRRSGR